MSIQQIKAKALTAIRSRSMLIQQANLGDIQFYTIVTLLYLIIYVPRTFIKFPSDYRPAVQQNMAYVAETLAQGSIPYIPPYPDYYSTAGGHLHGVAGTPFVWLIDSPAAPRLGVFFMGLISLFLFYSILKELGVSRAVASMTTVLLLIYPIFILFHTAGNPSAADLFFGLIAVYAYLQWRSEQTTMWLVASSIASGAATFSHFYSGVVAVGLLAHYALSTTCNLRTKLRSVLVYAAGMLPAGVLLILYKFVFAQSDPASHYTDRLLINSFDSLYATERIYGAPFSVFSNDFINWVMVQHGDKSPIFGHWWLLALVGIVLALGWEKRSTDQYDSRLLVLTWITAGSLTAILIPGGVLYHAYYTWWLMIGVFAGIGLSIESLLSSVRESPDWRDVVALLFPTLLIGSLLWTSLTSRWTALMT